MTSNLPLLPDQTKGFDYIYIVDAKEITRDQKLLAIKLKYYDGLEWIPKKGDYYTSARNDLELYQIVDEDEHWFYTNYCNPEQTTPNPAQWPKIDFKKGFGEKRIFVPDWVLKLKVII